jgi:hypothetical protein
MPSENVTTEGLVVELRKQADEQPVCAYGPERTCDICLPCRTRNRLRRAVARIAELERRMRDCTYIMRQVPADLPISGAIWRECVENELTLKGKATDARG